MKQRCWVLVRWPPPWRLQRPDHLAITLRHRYHILLYCTEIPPVTSSTTRFHDVLVNETIFGILEGMTLRVLECNNNLTRISKTAPPSPSLSSTHADTTTLPLHTCWAYIGRSFPLELFSSHSSPLLTGATRRWHGIGQLSTFDHHNSHYAYLSSLPVCDREVSRRKTVEILIFHYVK